MLRFSQYPQQSSYGLGFGICYGREPYNRYVGLHLHVWTWHAHLTWQFEGK